MRIALVIGTLDVGGTETQICRLASEFQARGHAVKVFVLIKSGPLRDRLEEDSVPFEVFHFQGFVYRGPDRRLLPRALLQSLVAVARFWIALRRFGPDVCHAFLPWAYMLAMPGATLAGVPVRLAGRRSLTSRLILKWPWQILHAVSTLSAHVIVANCQSVASDSQSWEPLTRAKLTVIPNGVDIPVRHADVAHVPPTGVMVANLIAYKGHDDVIEAIGRMKDPPVLRLAGDGPERMRLQALVVARGLDEFVVFEGSVPRVHDLLANAQFSILASHQEGLPNAVLEAMAWGLPVIATAVGGVTELIKDGTHGLLVPPNDPNALAAAMERIVSDPALRLRLGHAARERARDFSWVRCVSAHEHLYHRMLARSRLGLITRPPTVGATISSYGHHADRSIPRSEDDY